MDLKIVDVHIDSKDQASIVLCSLPPSWKNFVDILLYEKDSVSMDDASSSLKSKELKINFSDNTVRTYGESLISKRREFKARSNFKAKKVTCFECREQGHFRRDCSKLKDKKRKTK